MNNENCIDAIKPFKPVSEYKQPQMPTDESIRQFGSISWRWLRGNKKIDPFIADDSLSMADRKSLNKLAAPPACGQLLTELSLTFADWAADPEPKHWIQIVVLPPCDQSDVMRSWAIRENHQIIEPPSREMLLSRDKATIAIPETDKLLVVPRLERWFLRHHNGLGGVQALMDRMTRLKQCCVIGCNTWAWSFLSKAIQTQLFLPAPLSFQPFDKNRLMPWMEHLSHADDSSSVLRFSASGDTVFGEQANPRVTEDYFATLAARSSGIPWVAWHQWRKSLRLGPDSDQKSKQKFPNERSVWLRSWKEFEVPVDQAEAGLFILQSLLIHDLLTIDELNATVPGIHRSNVLSALLESGLVQRDGECFRCSPAAYPEIRRHLRSAGFPVAVL